MFERGVVMLPIDPWVLSLVGSVIFIAAMFAFLSDMLLSPLATVKKFYHLTYFTVLLGCLFMGAIVVYTSFSLNEKPEGILGFFYHIFVFWVEKFFDTIEIASTKISL